MIYSHKPQRSGRGIQANTNNPPQDPPPPPEIPVTEIPVTSPPIVETPAPEIIIPDIPIEDTTPPVPEPCIHEAPTLPKPEKKVIAKPIEKITLRSRIVSFFKKLFRRD